MKVSTKGRYALRIMIDLAENRGSLVPLKDISERQGITVKYLEQIVTLLVKNDFVAASRGNGGGYRLMREPSEYNIGDIFRASEGEFCTAPCTKGELCENYRECKASDFWRGLEKVVNDYINTQTLEDVLKNSRASSKRDPSIWIL